jgi:flavin-dependent dehydrogenase
MIQRTDVFVVGGGPAGLAAAIAARKKGFQVTVADGGATPIDKACGEGLLPDAIAALRDLGVAVHPGEGHAVRGIRFVGSANEVAADFPAGPGIGMKRPVLHQRLVERAQGVGVVMRWKTPITGVGSEGVVVAGDVVKAQWIIGADGLGSRVRTWSGLDARTGRGRRFAHRQHYRVKPWSDFIEVYWGENAQAYVTPIFPDEVCVVVISRLPGVQLRSIGEEFPRLARSLRDATPVGAARGGVTLTQTLPGVCRAHVALIGDASGSVDAITGEGLNLGFRQAIALGEALQAGDLSRYARAHRRLARRPALMGRLMLLLDGRAALRERALRALASDAELFARLVAIHVGATSGGDMASAGALLGWRFVAA